MAAISALADSDGRPGGLGASTSYRADDSFASFSNYRVNVVSGNPVTSPGAGIDLLMPGVNIYSCWMGGGYRSISGTSMASRTRPAWLRCISPSMGGPPRAGVYAIRQALIDAGMNQASGMRLAHRQRSPIADPRISAGPARRARRMTRRPRRS